VSAFDKKQLIAAATTVGNYSATDEPKMCRLLERDDDEKAMNEVFRILLKYAEQLPPDVRKPLYGDPIGWRQTTEALEKLRAEQGISEPKPDQKQQREYAPFWAKVCTPIAVLKFGRDLENCNWTTIVRVQDLDSQPHIVSIPAEWLSGDTKALLTCLRSHGLRLCNRQYGTNDILDYLNAVKPQGRARTAVQGGWYETETGEIQFIRFDENEDV